MTQQPLSRTLLAGGLAAAGARLAYAALRRRPPGGERHWTRANHRGEPVTLVEGPAVAAGALAVLAAERAFVPGTPATALAIAGTGAAVFGACDDLAGSGRRRGLRGHLGALRHGEVTTGAVKLLGIGATGLTAAVVLPKGGERFPRGALPPFRSPFMGGQPVPPCPPPGGPSGPQPGTFGAHDSVDLIINAGLIAGGANLLNLFDLRPGRAIKVAGISGVLLAAGGAGSAAAPALGAAAALLPEDLGERAMLGDCGANAIGALLGAAAAAALPRPARAGLLAGITALTLASEKISFTRVIASTPALHWLDMLGRRPPAGTADTQPAP